MKRIFRFTKDITVDAPDETIAKERAIELMNDALEEYVRNPYGDMEKLFTIKMRK